MRLTRLLYAAGAAMFLAVNGSPVQAQKFPDRPVRLVAPYAPGGGVDILARLIAQKYGELWGTQMIVENKPGASGLVGARYVATSEPNGYTLVLIPNSMTMSAATQKDQSFDLRKDLAPVGMIAASSLVLVINSSVPAKSFPELLSYAKANPGRLNYGSAGPGSSSHLAGELLNMMAGIKTVHVPYKGSGANIPAVLGGETEMTYVSSGSIEGFTKDERLRVLATLGPTRDPSLPNVPTIKESGLPGYEVAIWYSLFAPAKTPPGIIAQLNRELKQILDAPGMKEDLAKRGFIASWSTPEALDKVVATELVQWKNLADRIGLKDMN